MTSFAGDLQSMSWMAMALGGICGSLFGGFALVVVLHQGLEADLFDDFQRYLEDFIIAELRQWFISMIKELNQEEPGLGDSGGIDEESAKEWEHTLLQDSMDKELNELNKSLEQNEVLQRKPEKAAMATKKLKELLEALISNGTGSNGHVIARLCSCMSSSGLCYVERRDSTTAGPKDVKDMFASLKDSLENFSQSIDILKHQVMVTGNDPIIEGFVDCARLVHMMLTQDDVGVKDSSSNHVQYICLCMDVVFSNNVFQFWLG
ncbi:hypothetical protein ACH5RR_010036 [Cinchona calisaya]|uniref:Uncharacterized protein n=1 Tax=Cinchona calisaya TaxID=153742 RepID=A0ABD3AG29_9GENT